MAAAALPSPPAWVWVWLLVSSLIVMFDSAFVVLRPRSFPEGDLGWVWGGPGGPYDTYTRIDHRYRDLADGLGIVQAWLNFPEVLVAAAAFAARRRPSGWLLLLAGSLMTLWKTCVYLGADAVLGFASMSEVSSFDFWALYLAPASFWLVVPYLVVRRAWRVLVAALEGGGGDKKRQ